LLWIQLNPKNGPEAIMPPVTDEMNACHTNGHAGGRDKPLDPRPHEEALREGEACFDAALKYESLGLSVLQLCPPDHVGVGKGHGKGCCSPGKVPFGLWKEFQSRRATDQQIRDRWRARPTFNVGAATGPVSGIVAIDRDGADGARMIQEASGGDLPPTWQFQTPGGERHLYKIPDGVSLRPTHMPGGEKHQGFSLLGEGAQTVMPPSRHAGGGYYSWTPGHAPGEIDLAPAPAWLVRLMTQDSASGRAGKRNAHTLTRGETVNANRNILLTSLAGTMRRRGMDEAEILPALRAVNEGRCDPPLPDDEVAGIARKICNYEPADPVAICVPADPGGNTGYEITRRFFAEYYQPVFRRGTVLYSGFLGREVRMAEACGGAPIALIDRLAAADDAPCDNKGNRDRAKLPYFFSTWCRSAWADILRELPEEEATIEISDTAGEEFRGKVSAALHTIVGMGHRMQDGRGSETDIQRRSLLNWCELWAKPGRWAQVRSYALWTRLEPQGNGQVLRVALRVELFGQVGRQEKLTQNKFDRLAGQYGVAEERENAKVNGTRCTVLLPEFVAGMLAQPEDLLDEMTIPNPHARACV
jgi:hypothetical protein